MKGELNMKVVITGAGSFGTALGNILIKNQNAEVNLLARKKEIAASINNLHTNNAYYPHFILDEKLKATVDKKVLQSADIIFLAIPSSTVIEYTENNLSSFSENSTIVILSKGFGKDNMTLVDSLKRFVPNEVCSLKGPTFSTDLIHNNPSAFTVAATKPEVSDVMRILFADTNIYLDYSDDILGVEIASALKNIYAILLGIIDAHFNSANVRFLILTKAFNEMKNIILYFGGMGETLFKYCGFGDFGLTALNDLSRNRTLGLLIGKGFLDSHSTNSVILEGIRTIDIVYNSKLIDKEKRQSLYMLQELYRLFNTEYSIQQFIENIFNKLHGS
jgi:glycerol-3-phosphate dehydrogenase (NAD(P)+)